MAGHKSTQEEVRVGCYLLFWVFAWGSREVAPFKLRKNGVINQNIGENERVGKADSPTAGGIKRAA